MAATASMVLELRRMIAEPTSATYSDRDLEAAIEKYPLIDELGLPPYTWDYSTTPPSRDEQETWVPTYDLHAAAADLWQEKASLLVGNFDFSADGASFSRSQGYEMHMKQARHHQARRAPSTIKQVMEPRLVETTPFPVNARELED